MTLHVRSARRAARAVILLTLAAALPAGAATTGAKPVTHAPPAKAVAPPSPTSATPPSATTAAAADSGMTLHGGQEGTVFKSLTIQGEDRIRYEVERPALHLELDPEKAPGLDWGSARDVLERTQPDLATPLTGLSAHDPSPCLARPWLSGFATGAVARFQPAVKGVERWKLLVVDSHGETVAAFEGRGEPSREIVWDGRTKGGSPVVPGLTYSYVFEAYDKAGNKRNFVGEGFKVSAYRLDSADGPLLVFNGGELATSGDAVAPIVLEAASWLNQTPRPRQVIRVTASARTGDQANALATTVTRGLQGHVLGDPARLQPVAEIRPDAPEGGTVRIAFTK